MPQVSDTALEISMSVISHYTILAGKVLPELP